MATFMCSRFNPRASRTVPFVAKVIGEPIAKIATRIMAGESLESFGLKPKTLGHMGVKEAVFPFARFPARRAARTGDALHRRGHGPRPDLRHGLRQEPARGRGHRSDVGTVFVSFRDDDKPRILDAIRSLHSLGFKIIATSGNQRYLVEEGVPCGKINKVLEGRPHIVDAIKNGEVQLVFNTTEGAQALSDSVRCVVRPSCRRSPITPLLPELLPPRRASRPISRVTSRCARCRAISAIPDLRALPELRFVFTIKVRGARRPRPPFLYSSLKGQGEHHGKGSNDRRRFRQARSGAEGAAADRASADHRGDLRGSLPRRPVRKCEYHSAKEQHP